MHPGADSQRLHLESVRAKNLETAKEFKQAIEMHLVNAENASSLFNEININAAWVRTFRITEMVGVVSNYVGLNQCDNAITASDRVQFEALQILRWKMLSSEDRDLIWSLRVNAQLTLFQCKSLATKQQLRLQQQFNSFMEEARASGSNSERVNTFETTLGASSV